MPKFCLGIGRVGTDLAEALFIGEYLANRSPNIIHEGFAAIELGGVQRTNSERLTLFDVLG
jgi:hypothetical protein